jgi:beta-barrel assembly-enhancing protease
MTARMKALGSFALAAILALTGCQAVKQGAADIIASTGKVSQKDAQALVKTAEVLRSTFADITEEEEYYIGRATAALILAKYKPYRNEALNAYVNVMGTVLAYNSDRPETYAGYHFLVLDTDEVNAMAAPGGFIFVTRGLVKRCGDEETLAAILAHEIGHVAERHGLQSIKKSRLIEAFKVIGGEASQRLDSEELTKLTGLFEGVLGDVVETLVERGYDRKFEYEADKLALSFAVRTGYSPGGLAEFLKGMEENQPSGPAAGWFKTHPSAADRLARVKIETAALGAAPAKLDVRTARFAEAVKNLR